MHIELLCDKFFNGNSHNADYHGLFVKIDEDFYTSVHSSPLGTAQTKIERLKCGQC